MGRHRQLLIVILFVVLLAGAAELGGLHDHVSLGYLHNRLEAHPWSGLGLFILLFAVGNLIQIPGWIFLSAAVLALGRTMGGIATYAAALISCAVTFFTIRCVGGDALRQLDNRIAKELLGRLDAHPVLSIALLRVLFQTLPAVNYALALSGVRFGPYMAGTLLGLPLPILAYCIFFDYLAMLLIGPY